MDKDTVEMTLTPDHTTVKFRHEGQLIEWTRSHAKAVVGGVEVSEWVSQRRQGRGGPDMFIKAAVRDGSPQVVELSFTSRPGQSEVRPKHLRDIDLEQLAKDLYGFEVIEADLDDGGAVWEKAGRAADKFIERQRLPRDYRRIDDALLREVAAVYRANFSSAPTQAVAKHFGVKDRMAATYVKKARDKKFLPQTKRGKKQA